MGFGKAARHLWHRAEGLVNGRRHRGRIEEKLPFVRNGSLRETAALLRPAHGEYLASVSRADMAVSLELAAFLGTLCTWLRPARIIDLGSGFSSFVFRRYAREAGDCDVWSVDDDSQWLERTRRYLEGKGLSCRHLCLWDDFVQGPPRDWNLVLHDLGGMSKRKAVFDDVMRLGAGALVVLDDMHKPRYGPFARRQLKSLSWSCLSLRPFTLDALGRYSELAFRERPGR